MKLQSPYKATYKNLLLTKDGEVWAYYKIQPTVISSANFIKKEEHKTKFKNFLVSLNRFGAYHLQLYSRDMELDKRFDELADDFDKNLGHISKYYADETVSLLNQQLNHMITRDVFVLGVPISNIQIEQDFTQLVKSQVNQVTHRVVNFFGLEYDINSEYFNQFETAELELFGLVSSIKGERLSEDELNYIQRLSYVGQTKHDIDNELIKRGASEICNCKIDATKSSKLKLTVEEQQHYQSFLVLDSTPDDIHNFNLFEKVQNFGFPISVHIKGIFENNDKLRFSREMKSKQINEKTKDQHKTNRKVSTRSIKNFRLLNELGDELEANKVFTSWIAVLVISADTEEQLKQRVKQVQRRFMSDSYHFVNPVADQLFLFYQCLHGHRLVGFKFWQQLTTVAGLSQCLFSVTQILGTQVGFYIGRIDKYLFSPDVKTAVGSSRDIVLFHPMLANKGIKGAKTDSPHISVTGATGKGKSFLAKMLFYISQLLDTKVLYFDPKSEMKKWHDQVLNDKVVQQKYPLFIELIQQIKYVTLDYTDKSNFGVLDPIVFLEGAEAIEMSKGVFDEVIDTDKMFKVETALLQSIKKVVEARASGEQVGSLNVIQLLQKHDDKLVRAVGDNLFEKTQDGLLKLMFHDGSNSTLSINNKSTILQILGLDLPDANTSVDSYSDSEQKSVALMLVLAKFMEKFGQNKDEQTVVFIDEAWSMLRAKIGQKVKKSLMRIGRSMNNAVIFITQSVNDTDDDNDHGNFGCIFAFDNEAERGDILEHLGLEYDKDSNVLNFEMLKQLAKGQCLFRDFYGRTAKLSVHCLFEEWTQALQTVEFTKSAELEQKYI